PTTSSLVAPASTSKGSSTSRPRISVSPAAVATPSTTPSSSPRPSRSAATPLSVPISAASRAATPSRRSPSPNEGAERKEGNAHGVAFREEVPDGRGLRAGDCSAGRQPRPGGREDYYQPTMRGRPEPGYERLHIHCLGLGCLTRHGLQRLYQGHDIYV